MHRHQVCGRVLLVENEPAVRFVLAEALSEAGHQVEAACGCREAGALMVAPRPFDLLVTDLSLGDGDGRDLMALAAAQGLPAVAITGHPDYLRDEPCADHPPLLAKPFRPERLVATIEQVLADRRG